MSDGKLVKMEKDFTNEVDQALQVAKNLSQSGKLQQALDSLAALEKQTRNGADLASNSRVLVAILQLCFEAKDWKLLQEQVQILSKKHGLLKQAITKMIQEAVSYVEKTPNMQVKLELIDTLRTITEGKIYVEIEGARLTRILADIREKEGKINEAADILQELQVETFGSMEKREKTDFILEQMRLNLARKDYTRTAIISKKINTKYFEKEPEAQDLKLRYFELMIQYALHDSNYLDTCKFYREVYKTPSVLEDESKWSEILRYIVMFIVLSPHDNEQNDFLHRIKSEKNLEKLGLYKQLIVSFTTNELMRWPKVTEFYGPELRKSFVFSSSSPDGVKRWQDLHTRVVEHNIRVIAKYYHRITIKRLIELLDMSAKETEDALSRLVSAKTIFAKIDRLDGIVVFTKRQQTEEVMSEWSQQLSTLLDLVNQTTHLIAKEEMIHKIATK